MRFVIEDTAGLLSRGLGAIMSMSRWINIQQKGAGEEFQTGVLVVLVSCFEDVMIARMRATWIVWESVLLRLLRNWWRPERNNGGFGL